tara:strand:- start:3983 stop:5095 length:1113 start_codon:yes stop_codon:yes gene_type:complete
MKKQLSAYELGYLVKELQFLVHGKISKVYQPDIKKIVLQVHVPSKGKQLLSIYLPGFLFLASSKLESPLKPFGFCTFLRKNIEGNKILSIEQKGFERIIEINLGSKDKERKLILELFGKGNVILCEKDYTITGLLEPQKLKDRDVRGGVTYEFPKQPYDIDKMDDVTKAINASKQDTIVKTIAVDLGLGGNIAEEICKICEFEPELKIPKYGIMRVFEAFKEIRERKLNPKVVYDKEIIDVVPNEFLIYGKYKQHSVKTFSEGLDKLVSFQLVNKEKNVKEDIYGQKLQKMEKLFKNQEKQLKDIEDDVLQNTQKADKLYEQYQVVKEALDLVKGEIDSGKDWSEIKKKFKGHEVIKEIDAKEKKVLIEL